MPNYEVASVTELAEWIVTRINDITWSVPIKAIRVNYPFIETDRSDFPIVTVWPNSIQSAITPRCKTTDDPIITLQTYIKSSPFDVIEQDKGIKFCEELRDWFREQEQAPTTAKLLPSNTNIYEIVISAVIDNDTARDHNLFSQRIDLRYKIRRNTSNK